MGTSGIQAQFMSAHHSNRGQIAVVAFPPGQINIQVLPRASRIVPLSFMWAQTTAFCTALAQPAAKSLSHMRPGNLFSTRINAGYHRLTDPNFNHNSLYVDGTPTISDAYIKTGRTKQWRTILAGIQGGGGRGLFALDITDPDTFRESNASDIVLWEFTDQHDAHLGYTFSKPTIVLMNNGRWAAITGNGLDDSATDGTGGQSQLFIIYLDGGLDGIWSYGTDYIRIPTGVGSISKRNGLFSPAVIDLDNNGTADRVYAGDLNGHLWAFDLSSQDQNLWGLAYGRSSTLYGELPASR